MANKEKATALFKEAQKISWETRPPNIPSRAIELAEKALTEDPDFIKAAELIANDLRRARNYEKSVAMYKYALARAHDNDPDNYKLLRNLLRELGRVLVLDEKYEEAVEYLEKSLEIESTSASEYLAAAYNKLGRHQDVINLYSHVEQVSENGRMVDEPALHLGRAYKALGNHEKAISIFEAGLNFNSENEDVRAELNKYKNDADRIATADNRAGKRSVITDNKAISLEDLGEQLRKIASAAFSKAGITAKETAFDETKFNAAVELAYKSLPLPMRAVIRKEGLKNKLSEMRDRLFQSKEGGGEGIISHGTEPAVLSSVEENKGEITLKGMGALYDQENAPPDCILTASLDKHIANVNEFKSVVQALWFDSGPADNPTARSYVFYFFRGEVDENRRPDDILTFKVKFDNPFKVHIISKYLGGAAYGAVNAPALAQRHLWSPGLMSEEGKQEYMKTFSQENKGSVSGGASVAKDQIIPHKFIGAFVLGLLMAYPLGFWGLVIGGIAGYMIVKKFDW